MDNGTSFKWIETKEMSSMLSRIRLSIYLYTHCLHGLYALQSLPVDGVISGRCERRHWLAQISTASIETEVGLGATKLAARCHTVAFLYTFEPIWVFPQIAVSENKMNIIYGVWIL